MVNGLRVDTSKEKKIFCKNSLVISVVISGILPSQFPKIENSQYFFGRYPDFPKLGIEFYVDWIPANFWDKTQSDQNIALTLEYKNQPWNFDKILEFRQ